MYYLFTNGHYYAPFEYGVEINNFKEWGDYLKSFTSQMFKQQPLDILAYPAILFGYFTVGTGNPSLVFNRAKFLRMDEIDGKPVTVYDYNTGNVTTINDYRTDVDDYVTEPVDEIFKYLSYGVYIAGPVEYRFTTAGSFRDFLCTITPAYNLLVQGGMRNVDLGKFLTLLPIYRAFTVMEDAQKNSGIVYFNLSFTRYMPFNVNNDNYYYFDFASMTAGGRKFRYKNVSNVSNNYGCPMLAEPGVILTERNVFS